MAPPSRADPEPFAPHLGHGVGLRAAHYADWESDSKGVEWAECITENYLDVGGRPRQILRRVRERMPVVLHGVSLSIGGVDPLDREYISSVKRLALEVEPAWVSDHLCWVSFGGHYLHDLLPLPYTEEALTHLASRVLEAEDLLGRPLVLENPSTYLQFSASAMTEWEFLTELVRRTGSRLLLDLNNVYVNARNHGFSAEEYLRGIPTGAVVQFHLAGHTDLGDTVIDTHDAPVCDAVWSLYASAVRRFGELPTLVEWDAKLPTFGELVAESRRAAATARAALRADG